MGKFGLKKSLLLENIISRLTVNENNRELVAALIRTYQMTGHRARTGLKKNPKSDFCLFSFSKFFFFFFNLVFVLIKTIGEEAEKCSQAALLGANFFAQRRCFIGAINLVYMIRFAFIASSALCAAFTG